MSHCLHLCDVKPSDRVGAQTIMGMELKIELIQGEKDIPKPWFKYSVYFNSLAIPSGSMTVLATDTWVVFYHKKRSDVC